MSRYSPLAARFSFPAIAGTIGLLSFLLWLRAASHAAVLARENCWQVGKVLPDLSGLAWLERENVFLAVHDAKGSSKKPRVSLIQPATESQAIAWCALQVNWPDGPAEDLESIAAIPESNLFILAESGTPSRRLFLAEYGKKELKIIGLDRWDRAVENVEGTAVFKLGQQEIFLYAERAEGKGSTEIRWANLSLQPFRIGPWQEVTFFSPDPSGPNTRQISTMEVDGRGNLYIAAAEDPNNDSGPFRSVVWQVGQIKRDRQQQVKVILNPLPERIATLDGLKVESLAIRQTKNSPQQIFIGTDDEIYGGILRSIPGWR